MAVFICCNSNPSDTSYNYYYYYNIDNTLDRIENFERGKLIYITQYLYDSCNKAIKQLTVVPYTLDQFCGNNMTEDCFSKIREHSFRHDTITDIYYVIHWENIIQPMCDTIFKKSKLIAILSGTDTLNTYCYDKKNRLIKRFNYYPGSKKIISWTKYKYRDNQIIEYEYKPDRKRNPYMSTESEYNSANQVIKKTTTYLSYKKTAQNQYIIENYSYKNGRISMYEISDKTNSSCDASICCNNYKKYFVYKEKN